MSRQIPNQKSILISGWYGHDNGGDEAILQQFLSEMMQDRGVRVQVLCENPERIQELYGVDSVYHSYMLGRGCLRDLVSGRLRKHWNALRGTDLFVLGGGGLLRDNISWKNALRLLDEIWFARLFGLKSAIYAIGAGPFRSKWYRWILKQSLRWCDLITVREETSKELLIDIGVPSERIRVTGDPALLLPAQPPAASPEVDALLAKASEPGAVGLFTKSFADLPRLSAPLDVLHERYGLRFVAVPLRCHSHGDDDRDAARLVRAGMRNPQAVYVYDAPLTAREVKWVAGQFRFNLSVRLHGLIFSTAMGVPAVAINYEPKVANFLKSLWMEDLLVEPGAGLESRLVEAVSCCRSDLTTYEEHLRRIIPRKQQAASESFTALRAVVDSVDGARPRDRNDRSARFRAAMSRGVIGASKLPFYAGMKLLLLAVLGRIPFCSLGRARRAYTAFLRRDEIYTRWQEQCRVVRQEPDGLVLWDTPRGTFWAPGNTSRAALSLILAEQEVKAYGEGEAGVRHGDIVVDCGANIGVFTREALAAGAERVIAVEPAPENVQCLRRNVEKEIAAGRVVICEKGLWNSEDILTLFVDPNNAGGNSFITRNTGSYECTPIAVTTVDRLVEEFQLDRVDFIKVDVEAAEQRVLTGARKTLKKFRPRLAVAVEHTPDRFRNAKGVAEVVHQMRPDYRVDSSLCYVWDRRVVLPEVLHFC